MIDLNFIAKKLNAFFLYLSFSLPHSFPLFSLSLFSLIFLFSVFVSKDYFMHAKTVEAYLLRYIGSHAKQTTK